MSKIIAIVGVTDTQDVSVVQTLLKQGGYKIRGITWSINSDKAKALRTQGVELVAAALNDATSLVKAFYGVTAIFAVTDFNEPFSKDGPDHAMDVEYKQGVNLARAALQTPTLKHYIWSTLPNSRKISDGKFVVPHFDAKSCIDDFIKSEPALLGKTTFLWVAFNASNFFCPVFQAFLLKSIGTYAYIQPVAPSTVFALAGDALISQCWHLCSCSGHPLQPIEDSLSKSLFNGDYIKLWELKDIGFMLQFWEHVGEKRWFGEELLPAGDLAVKVTTEEAFRIGRLLIR